MSNTPFAELRSADPAERAIAHKVIQILNDRALDREQRETLVRQAQRELIELRRHQQEREALLRQLTTVQLPAGWQAQSIAVSNGRVQVAAIKKGGAFAWFDAGPAPEGVRSATVQLRVGHMGKVATR